jgi:hypothetical protein
MPEEGQALWAEAVRRGLVPDDVPPQQELQQEESALSLLRDAIRLELPGTEDFRFAGVGGGLQAQAQQAFAGTPEVEPSGDLLTDVGTALSNVPRSAADVASGLFSLFTPSGISSAVSAVGQGLGGAYDIATGEGGSERANLARQLFKEMTRMFREPGKTLINDPVGAALDIASIATLGAGTAAKGLSVLSQAAKTSGKVARATAKLSSIASKADPISATMWVGGKMLGKANLASLSGVATGAGTEAFQIARAAGRAGGKRSESFKAAQMGERSIEDVSESVRKGVDLLKNERSRGFGETIKDATLEADLNLKGIREAVFKELEDNHGAVIRFDRVEELPNGIHNYKFELEFKNNAAGVRLRSPGATRERAQLESLVNQMYEMGNNPTSWKKLHEIKKSIADFETPKRDPLGATFMDRTLTQVRQRIGNELNTKVSGFKKASDDYAAASNELEKIVKSLSVKGGGPITETELTKLGNILNVRASGNLGLRKDAIHIIESTLSEVTGETISIMDELAGLRLARPETLGIARAQAGRGGGIGAALGAGAGFAIGGPVGGTLAAFLGKGLGQLLGNMTIRNPRAVGSFFHGLGTTERKAAQIMHFVTDLKKLVPERFLIGKTGARKALTVVGAWEIAQEDARTKEAAKALLAKLGME